MGILLCAYVRFAMYILILRFQSWYAILLIHLVPVTLRSNR